MVNVTECYIESINGKDDIPIYEMENNPNVWNHQPVIIVNICNTDVYHK